MSAGRRYSRGGKPRQDVHDTNGSFSNRFHLLSMDDENDSGIIGSLEASNVDEKEKKIDEQRKEIAKNLQTILKQTQTIHRKEDEIARLDRKLYYLKTEIAHHQHRVFEKGRIVGQQRDFFNQWKGPTERGKSKAKHKQSSGEWRKGAGRWNGPVEGPKPLQPKKVLLEKKKAEVQQKLEPVKMKDAQIKEAVTRWSVCLLYKLINWLWDNGHATVFQSKCLKYKEHQEKLIDVLRWSTGSLNYTVPVQNYIEDILRKVIELALNSPRLDSMTDLPGAVESFQLPLNDQEDVLSIVSKTPHIGKQRDPFLPAYAMKDQNQDNQMTTKKTAPIKSSAPNLGQSPIKTSKARKSTEELEEEEEVDESMEPIGINDVLASLLDSKQVPHYQIIHDPSKDGHLEVIGTEVDALVEELSLVAQEKGYTLSTRNKEIELGSHGIPPLSNWLVSCGGIAPNPMFSLHSNDGRIVTINVIMQAVITRRKSSEEYFALSTAHAVLSKEQRKHLDGCTFDFDRLFDEVEKEFSSKGYYMAVKETDPIDMMPFPQWIYKYYVKRGDSSEWAALQDIAFLHLVGNQVHEEGLICSGNQDVSLSNSNSTDFQDAYIKKISSKQSAQTLVGRRITCKGQKGTLIKSSTTKVEDTQKKGHVMGVHLEFKFDNPLFRLMPGDCGCLVYLADKVEGKLPIIGMFFGQLLENTAVHCAIILSWNINLATKADKLKLSNIRLATHSPEAECEPAEEKEAEPEQMRPLKTERVDDTVKTFKPLNGYARALMDHSSYQQEGRGQSRSTIESLTDPMKLPTPLQADEDPSDDEQVESHADECQQLSSSNSPEEDPSVMRKPPPHKVRAD